MRLLHTSDWHLGQTLHNYERGYEHQRFLDWLLDTLVAERVDVLLVAKGGGSRELVIDRKSGRLIEGASAQEWPPKGQ